MVNVEIGMGSFSSINDSCGGLPWAGRFAIIPLDDSASLRSSQRWPE